jgi:biopolymer transport protein TolR
MKRGKGRRLMGQMNVVPYIDVMLVLLIIFMITAPMLQAGITVDLPQVDSAPLDPDLLQDNEPLVLSIDADGNFYLNLGETPDEPISEESAATTTAAVLRRNPATPVMVKADSRVSHGRVVVAYKLLQDAGAEKLSILTDPLEAEDL